MATTTDGLLEFIIPFLHVRTFDTATQNAADATKSELGPNASPVLVFCLLLGGIRTPSGRQITSPRTLGLGHIARESPKAFPGGGDQLAKVLNAADLVVKCFFEEKFQKLQ